MDPERLTLDEPAMVLLFSLQNGRFIDKTAIRSQNGQFVRIRSRVCMSP